MPNDILHLFCRDGLAQSKPLQEQAMSKTPVLEMRNIAKVFGKFYALKGVDLTVYPGEIHALMGKTAPVKAP
jgi:ribose transport system ATP-binding protein